MSFKNSYKILYFGGLMLLSQLFISCYSFTGSSLKPDVKTLSIKTFPNNAPYNNPNLSQQFTVDLQNRFLQRTNLKGTTQTPDILIEGEISDYQISPTTISSPTMSNQTGNILQAAENKLTITVKVHYENAKYPQEGFDRTYSDEAVFKNDLTIQQIETSQVKIATDRIINRIFNDIVANW
ncbi:hypothetical protein GNY06_12650 [Elizabethkingia argentiflava]|uniref:Lipopolysaccharide-assembly n=1 Tax=Elizabethkingia argenteiflava TaxID=2681556 RepID=A0A845PZF3_9FLAO|nr:LPS assembly lipoprotein LptE [Elizabethkingia argenteiflava]NAW52186.1 hypothetical protein [Elizabethkingia argenteiflava]